VGGQRYRFGGFELDASEQVLHGAAGAQQLQPKVAQMLVWFLDRPGALVTREELFAALWPGTHVADEALTQIIAKLRRALDDDPKRPRFLETVPRRGYRLLATVEQPASAPLAPAALPSLPAYRDRFVGRQEELGELAARFAAGARLVVLLGPGGAGKTRLACRYAGERAADWPGGVRFCDASEARSADEVAHAAGRALDLIAAGDDPVAHAAAAMRACGRALFLFDNFEQVVGHAAATLARFVDSAPEACFLVTSRERLKLRGEIVLEVAPLPLADSIALFAERASTAAPSFHLDGGNGADVARLARLLDGLPLAIELAAARTPVLSPAAMVERLGRRFELLRSSQRDVAPRHSTLAAAIDWSWELLDPPQRSALMQLALFDGGFDLDAAEAVLDLRAWPGALAIDVVQSLTEKSLLKREAARFGMLAAVREYAAERLRDHPSLPSLRRRHAAHFVALAERIAPELWGRDQLARLRRLAEEHDNLRAALEWALAHDGELAVRLGAALWRFWWMQGHLADGRRWLERALAVERTTPLRGRALLGLGVITHYLGDYPRAQAALDELLAAARAAGDVASEIDGLHAAAAVALQTGGFPHAHALYQTGDDAAARLGDARRIAANRSGRGLLALYEGRLDEAARLYQEAIALHRQLGDSSGAASSLVNLGHTTFRQQRIDRAAALFEEALALFRAARNLPFVAECLEALAAVAARQSRDETAVVLWSAARALAEATGAVTDPHMRPEYERAVREAGARLPVEALDGRRAEGTALSADLLAGRAA
jgi:predicted ATPase/DNA-binding winged helix-turn-helix (wHTH) protein